MVAVSSLRCDRHLGIPGRVRFLHAVGVRGHGDRRPDDPESPIVAVHLLTGGVGERGFLAHAPRKQRNNSDYSEFTHGIDFLCSSGYRLTLTEPERFFQRGRFHGRIPRLQQNLFPEAAVSSPLHLPRIGEMPPLPDQPAQWGVLGRWLGVLIVTYGGAYGLYRLGCWLVRLALS